MQLQQNDHGFRLSADTVTYDFITSTVPVFTEGLYTITVTGNAPVPILEKTDRLILPVDEGIAITVGQTYQKGELDIHNIGGDFMRREGTMSLVLVERQGHYLLICLQDGMDAGYRARQMEDEYRLEITCHTPHTVFYGIFSTLPEACATYKRCKNIHTVPLVEKLAKYPEAYKLTGGIFWVWSNHYDEVMYADHDVDVSPLVGDDLLTVAADLHENGVDKAMFGIFFDGDSPYTKDLYDKFGYICTQYDNYNDVLNPEILSIIPGNRVRNCGYTKRRMKDYPDGVTVMGNGALAPAWSLKGFDGQMHPQNTLCPLVAAARMREEIPAVLQTYSYYKGRFIDVYGTGVTTCHSEQHPLTKAECLAVKISAFAFLGELGLIAGTEDGFEDLIDQLVYAEGLHSPVYFRNVDSGRKHTNPYTPERAAHIAAQMLSPACRVPLWHLVYHDSLLAFPYWGDSTESARELLQEKILYACLYGCPPLYSFFVKDYAQLREDILQSYQKIAGVLTHTALLPMTDYAVLRDDYSLQRTVFGETWEVVANFSDTACLYKENTIAPKDFYFGHVSNT